MDKPLRILVLEDQVTDAELLIREVKHAGFTPEWHRVETEAAYLAGLEDAPDLILSDYSLPHFDGLRAVILLRERGLDTPFILISGTLGEEAAVEAMKLGVDDYLLKDRTARLGLAIEHLLKQKQLRNERNRAQDEIKDQLHELQRWHETMLDREGRILDLKREVNELLALQNQPPRYSNLEAL